ncbi:MAG: phospholipid-binding lipoprotein MlaA [Rhodospirillaceae bacterium]|nr:phospholipid-binding lipoprotein MlaA [Rhodospirillaceae bacterium]
MPLKLMVRPSGGATLSIPRKKARRRPHAPSLKPPPTARRPWAAATLASGIALALTLALAACAHPPTDPEARADYERNNDPAEPTNRVIFAGNKFVDDNALQPVARGYEDYVPGRVQKSVHNFVSNLGQPSIAVNDGLQGNFGRSWHTIQRFAINTTAGGAGFFDVATDWNRPGHFADFGQTLGVWGVDPGPSVQLPLFGASNVRDSVGKVADLLMNPINFVPGGVVTNIQIAGGGAGLIDGRADLLSTTDALEHNSLDYYAALRSMAAQHRAALVAEGKAGDVVVHKDGDPTSEAPAGAAQ